ncbi:transcriptional regulator [Salmonella phage SeF1]|nr:transcriptional regulator [Salmonella phage SeF1]
MDKDTDWRGAALQMRSDNMDAIAMAQVDAEVYGSGWIKVDVNGGLTRINPIDIVITIKALNKAE